MSKIYILSKHTYVYSLSKSYRKLRKDKIRFEWDDIIYDMSKARHLLWSVSLTPFLSFPSDSQLFELNRYPYT